MSCVMCVHLGVGWGGDHQNNMMNNRAFTCTPQWTQNSHAKHGSVLWEGARFRELNMSKKCHIQFTDTRRFNITLFTETKIALTCMVLFTFCGQTHQVDGKTTKNHTRPTATTCTTTQTAREIAGALTSPSSCLDGSVTRVGPSRYPPGTPVRTSVRKLWVAQTTDTSRAQTSNPSGG